MFWKERHAGPFSFFSLALEAAGAYNQKRLLVFGLLDIKEVGGSPRFYHLAIVLVCQILHPLSPADHEWMLRLAQLPQSDKQLLGKLDQIVNCSKWFASR